MTKAQKRSSRKRMDSRKASRAAISFRHNVYRPDPRAFGGAALMGAASDTVVETVKKTVNRVKSKLARAARRITRRKAQG